ncbi:MAG TPA: hypothetical protein VMV36_08540 [Ignavibacteriaceae bacterium]|nr:hypothetical protein [Ignavibacteriaceae bacterium]
MNWNDVFSSPDWLKLKDNRYSETVPLSRIEYVRKYGYKGFSEEKYQQYLKLFKEGENAIDEELDFANRLTQTSKA